MSNLCTDKLFRFDLIFLMLDPQDESFDRRLATHLVSLYYRTGARVRAESIVSNGTSVFYFLVSVFSRSLVLNCNFRVEF